MQKTGAVYKIAKSLCRGSVIAAFAVGQVLIHLIKYLIKFKEDVMSNKGICPACDKMFLVYSEPDVQLTNSSMKFKFNCENCKAQGYEIYQLDYIKSVVEMDLNG